MMRQEQRYRQSASGAGMEPDRGSLINAGFVILTVLFFLTSSAMAVFFQLQPYLQSIRVNPAWIGFIIGADSLASFIVQPGLAPYLHPGNARAWMAAGVLTMALALLAYTMGKGVGSLVVIRVAQGAGFVCFLAAMMAAIVAYIPPLKSGQGFAVLSLVRLLPYALVPPAATFLMGRSVTFPQILIGFALLVSFSLPVLFFIRKPHIADSGQQPSAGGPVGIRGTLEGLRAPSIQALLVVNLLVFICYTILFFYITGYGRHSGIPRTDLFFTVVTVMMIAVRLAGSTLFDRFDKFRLSAGSLAVLAFSFLLLPHARGWPFYGLAALIGLAWGIIMPLLNAMAFDASPPRLRGVNLNLTLVAMQGGFFLGPLAGGLMLASYGYTPLFTLCSPLTIIALAVLWLGKPAKGVIVHGIEPVGRAAV